MKDNSILQTKKICYVCGTTEGLHLHHVFYGTANRRLSDADGLTVYLCYKHHNGSNNGVHLNKKLDLELKKKAETKWLECYAKTKDDFIQRYGKNYI